MKTPTLPKTITYDLQPYGTVTLGNLRLEPNARVAARSDLLGEVISGSCTSYLCGHRSTKPVAPGTPYRVYGIERHELDRGHIVRVAM